MIIQGRDLLLIADGRWNWHYGPVLDSTSVDSLALVWKVQVDEDRRVILMRNYDSVRHPDSILIDRQPRGTFPLWRTL